MKAILALALLAVLGVVTTGCGAANKKIVVITDGVVIPAIPGRSTITLDRRIGPVRFAELEQQITKALGPGTVARLDGHRLRYYPRARIYVDYAPLGKQKAADFVITRSAGYKTLSGVGVGSSLRQLRRHVRVRCYDAGSSPDVCQHERANINLPFTVFNIDPTTKRVTQIAIVPGGD